MTGQKNPGAPHVLESHAVQTFEAECPHACVNKLIVEITQDMHTGRVVGIGFRGHQQTHDEWTGRPTA